MHTHSGQKNTDTDLTRRWLTSFGRRHGHALSAHKQELIAHVLPRLHVDLPADGGLLPNPQQLFEAGVKEVGLEIGFGAGEFLASFVRAFPEVGMIGCEPYINGVASLLTRLLPDENAAPPANLRLFTEDARLLLERLPPASLDRIYLLFPDPWPKARHHKRRIISPQTLDLFACALKEKGVLQIATDHPGYASWIIEHMLLHPAFSWTARYEADWRTPPPEWHETRYQRKMHSKGFAPFFLRYEKRTA